MESNKFKEVSQRKSDGRPRQTGALDVEKKKGIKENMIKKLLPT
jgi:hypothetical protein